MVKPIRNEPKFPTQSASPATNPYESTTKKVKAAASKVTLSQAQAKGLKEHKVTPQKTSGDNLASLVTKGSGKQRAQVVANLASPILSKPSLANVKKIRSAHIPNKPNSKLTDLSKKVLEKS